MAGDGGGGAVARRGRPDLSPLVASTPSRPFWCSVLLERVGRGGGGPGDGEDAPVGLGPRRTRPHSWARNKYTAPLKLHKERSVMGMSQVKLVGRGVDTLLLNVYYLDEQEKPVKHDLSNALVDRLDAWKQAAIEAEGSIVVPWVFEGANLQMYPHGAGRGQWRWLLTSDLINLCISRGRLNC